MEGKKRKEGYGHAPVKLRTYDKYITELVPKRDPSRLHDVRTKGWFSNRFERYKPLGQPLMPDELKSLQPTYRNKHDSRRKGVVRTVNLTESEGKEKEEIMNTLGIPLDTFLPDPDIERGNKVITMRDRIKESEVRIKSCRAGRPFVDLIPDFDLNGLNSARGSLTCRTSEEGGVDDQPSHTLSQIGGGGLRSGGTTPAASEIDQRDRRVRMSMTAHTAAGSSNPGSRAGARGAHPKVPSLNLSRVASRRSVMRKSNAFGSIASGLQQQTSSFLEENEDYASVPASARLEPPSTAPGRLEMVMPVSAKELMLAAPSPPPKQPSTERAPRPRLTRLQAMRRGTFVRRVRAMTCDIDTTYLTRYELNTLLRARSAQMKEKQKQGGKAAGDLFSDQTAIGKFLDVAHQLLIANVEYYRLHDLKVEDILNQLASMEDDRPTSFRRKLKNLHVDDALGANASFMPTMRAMRLGAEMDRKAILLEGYQWYGDLLRLVSRKTLYLNEPELHLLFNLKARAESGLAINATYFGNLLRSLSYDELENPVVDIIVKYIRQNVMSMSDNEYTCILEEVFPVERAAAASQAEATSRPKRGSSTTSR
eukprot:Rmarinus@m.2510